MSRFRDHLQMLAASGESLDMILAGLGIVFGVIESVKDDEVTVKLEGGIRVVLHYGQIAIRRD